jgi:hypothetical protein
MARGRGTDRRGRSKRAPPFAMLPHHLMDSAAWLGLSPGARAAVLEILRRFNGSNNGMIAAPVDLLAARLGARRQTVAKWLREAEAAGMIARTRAAWFTRTNPPQGVQRASEWRIMWLADNRNGAPPARFDAAPEEKIRGRNSHHIAGENRTRNGQTSHFSRSEIARVSLGEGADDHGRFSSDI